MSAALRWTLAGLLNFDVRTAGGWSGKARRVADNSIADGYVALIGFQPFWRRTSQMRSNSSRAHAGSRGCLDSVSSDVVTALIIHHGVMRLLRLTLAIREFPIQMPRVGVIRNFAHPESG